LYYHYTLREDYKNWLYENNKWNDKIELAIELLWSDNLYNSMCKVLKERPISSNENLTNISQNRQAYLWQASCCLEYWLSSDITIKARQKLDKNTQNKANLIADDVIRLFEIKHITKYYSLFTYEELCQ